MCWMNCPIKRTIICSGGSEVRMGLKMIIQASEKRETTWFRFVLLVYECWSLWLKGHALWVTFWPLLINRRQIYSNLQQTLVIIWRTIYASAHLWNKKSWDIVFACPIASSSQFYLEINIVCWGRTSHNHLLTLLFEREVQGDILLNVYLSSPVIVDRCRIINSHPLHYILL